MAKCSSALGTNVIIWTIVKPPVSLKSRVSEKDSTTSTYILLFCKKKKKKHQKDGLSNSHGVCLQVLFLKYVLEFTIIFSSHGQDSGPVKVP